MIRFSLQRLNKSQQSVPHYGQAMSKRLNSQSAMEEAIVSQTKEQYAIAHPNQGPNTEPLGHFLVRHDNWVAIGPMVNAEGTSVLNQRHPTLHTTPLMLAAQLGRLWCIDAITEAHPEALMAVDQHGRSALHFAAVYGQTGAVSTLLDKGAPWTKTDEATLAVIKSNPAIHALLLQRAGPAAPDRVTILDENPKKPSMWTKIGRVYQYYKYYVVPYSTLSVALGVWMTMDPIAPSPSLSGFYSPPRRE